MIPHIAIIIASIWVLYVAFKGCVETMLDAACGPEDEE